MGLKVLIAGGRDFNDYALLEDRMLAIHWETLITEVIEGGARGADTIGGEWADDYNIKRTTVKAEWDKYGKRAGWLRNNAMADLNPDLVVLFPGGRGTQMMHDIAKSRGIEIKDYRNG